ncbi:hypothetical protein [Fluviicola taffensis]|uniref:Uncharacterized protein n=1 Tax=Fluviicola taffensis (strain DSM 16823 / NCIMB 13979 / RW262) TaxID=755732 RepID=F2IA53_FLUTR|nr:hypothetical protein [Fluviicola taffensis]AEA45230.1 hypothetical protein Fluta_3257 [Fluviicola taffensis DSM 16823]
MKRNSLSIFVFLVFTMSNSFAQNVFPEQFKGCNTDGFALEHDTTTAKLNSIEFLKLLGDYLGADAMGKLRGKLSLQIIVDLEGNSCLLSIENKTNVKTKKLNLKTWIDQEIKWKKLSEKVGAMIVLEFTESGVTLKRLGMGGTRDWHYLD